MISTINGQDKTLVKLTVLMVTMKLTLTFRVFLAIKAVLNARMLLTAVNVQP